MVYTKRKGILFPILSDKAPTKGILIATASIEAEREKL